MEKNHMRTVTIQRPVVDLKATGVQIRRTSRRLRKRKVRTTTIISILHFYLKISAVPAPIGSSPVGYVNKIARNSKFFFQNFADSL